MNAEGLVAHYERIADAPGAIGSLRRFILDLAVRGKLVPQDPRDEPASELLKQIAKEKARLVKAGDLRKPRDLDDRGAPEEPFAVAATWRWARLDTVGAIIGGGTPSATDAGNFAEPGEGVPWLTPADLGGYSDLYISRGARDLSEKGSRTSSATVMPAGTVLFTSRAPIGYVAIAANQISTNQGFKSIVPYVADCSRFIATAMKAFAPEIDAKAPGTTFKEVSGKIVAAIPFPLPPLAEQHRIVAKVDELMALCDRLEAARAKREAMRDQMASASFARLKTPDPETFQDDARFVIGVLPTLTTRPDQIRQLRQIALNLAVRGKLVPQDLRDEPASELLKRIAVEKVRLIKEKKLKRQKDLLPIEMANVPFDAPDGWAWAKADDVFLNITDGFHNTPSPVAAGRPYVTAKHIRPNKIDFENCLYVDEKNHRKLLAKTRVRRGDILIVNIGAGCGIPAMVDVDFEFSFKNVAVVNLPSGMDGNFILMFLLYYRDLVFDDLIKGGAQPFLGLGMLRGMLIPLPPLAEQHRIVAKVDALMALCDRLVANLAICDSTRRRLLDALLAEALEPAALHELEAA